jgi:cephalosporin hydroxylase
MLTIDEARGRVTVCHEDGTSEQHALDTPAAFEAVSAAWLRCGWDVKYVYGFTWMGLPVIQLPEDLIRIQEVIWRLRPDVIVETGIAHGGSSTRACSRRWVMAAPSASISISASTIASPSKRIRLPGASR